MFLCFNPQINVLTSMASTRIDCVIWPIWIYDADAT